MIPRFRLYKYLVAVFSTAVAVLAAVAWVDVATFGIDTNPQYILHRTNSHCHPMSSTSVWCFSLFFSPIMSGAELIQNVVIPWGSWLERSGKASMLPMMMMTMRDFLIAIAICWRSGWTVLDECNCWTGTTRRPRLTIYTAHRGCFGILDSHRVGSSCQYYEQNFSLNFH